MRDTMKSCQHTLSNDVVYKEVVVIGNGPSGMVTSFMLAGNVPYLKPVPEDLPIDEMLRARLSNLPEGQSLYEVDLLQLAEGLEGRSHNPIPLLMDNLLRPCADLGIQEDPLIEWKYDVEKQIDHIVLGRGPPGGAWHTFPSAVRTLSPGAWLSLPPHTSAGAGRLPARSVANYCRRYVHKCQLTRYFRSGVVVSSVTRAPRVSAPPCARACPRAANFWVSGYDMSEGRPFRYACRRVIVACGSGDRPNTLDPTVEAHALHSLSTIERAVNVLSNYEEDHPSRAILVVGSGVSAADAVSCARGAGGGGAGGTGGGTRAAGGTGGRRGVRTLHVHRAPPDALARLDPTAYPDYCEVYKMMCDGSSGSYPNYKSFPDHVIVGVAPSDDPAPPSLAADYEAVRPKKVTLLNLTTNEVNEVTVGAVAVLIGSKPDLFFLQTNFNLNCIQADDCKCEETVKKKIDDTNFLRNHWLTFKNALGQSIQSCKSRYLNYSEINGNTDSKCALPDCNKRLEDCRYEIIPVNKAKCECRPSNPYSGGIGFGVDPKKPVDGRGNPIAIDKGTHELLQGPKGIYALGPVTADNFVRFIPGGALAVVADLHRTSKEEGS